jgi:hypothetical protein
LTKKIVNALDSNRFGTLPTATGGIARLAYGRAQRAGIDVIPLLKKAGLTAQQIKDQGGRFAVHHQIKFLNIVASTLGDECLGFHLAQSPDLREMGLLFYVAASSETLGDALQRAARYSSIANEGLALKFAWLLGYQEISAFTHAFKRWFGKSPMEARAQTVAARSCGSKTHTGL